MRSWICKPPLTSSHVFVAQWAHAMAAWLIHRRGGISVPVREEVAVGRDASRCKICVDGHNVSRVHCRFRVTPTGLMLLDESTNGLLVNGMRVGKVVKLESGDVIEVGVHQLSVHETTEILEVGQGPRPRSAHPVVEGSQGPLPPTMFPPPPFAPSSQPPRPPSMPPPLPPSVPEPPVTKPTMNVEPQAPFQVEVLEQVTQHQVRYRDAVRLADSALLVMTDFIGGRPLPAAMLAEWKAVMREAGTQGLGPDAVLQELNDELFKVGLQARASCARLDASEHLLAVSCAGASPPWILRAGPDPRVVRVQVTPSVELGRVRAAQFSPRTLHFDRGDALLLASDIWTPALEQLLAQRPPAGVAVGEWLRAQPRPPGGSLISLTMQR